MQQAMLISAMALLDPGEAVWIEILVSSGAESFYFSRR